MSMAWATTVVAQTDGSMRDYIDTIKKLRRREDALALAGAWRSRARSATLFARSRRITSAQREAAILQRLARGRRNHPANGRPYLPRASTLRLHGAAALTVFAHIEDLIARGSGESGRMDPADFSARYVRT